MDKSFYRVGAVLGILTLVPGFLLAATPSRIARDEPEIQLHSNGRTAVCDVLRFTPDGRELLAAGEDKVVHRWATSGTTLQPLPSLHWNTFRERRGAIYAMAYHADAKVPRVAIAGYGKLDPDVAVLDPRTGQIVAALSPETAPGYGTVGGTIWSLAWNSEGNELVIGDDFGTVWLWRVGGAVRSLVPGVEQASVESRVIWVQFLADGRIGFARRDGLVQVVGQDGRVAPLFGRMEAIARKFRPGVDLRVAIEVTGICCVRERRGHMQPNPSRRLEFAQSTPHPLCKH